MKKFVHWRSANSLSELKTGWKYDSRQINKSVHCRSACSLSVLNMRTKHDSRQMK